MKYGELMSILATQIPRTGEDQVALQVCLMASNEIWHAYDWHSTLGKITPFFLIPGEQDHSNAVCNCVPTDFMGWRTPILVQLNSDPPNTTELRHIKFLDITNVKLLPHAICFQGELPGGGGFRVYPRVPDNIVPPNYIVSGQYKKKPPTLTLANFAGTEHWMDDDHFQRVLQVMKWAAWDILGDERAGSVQMTNGMAVYTGQLAKAMQAIEDMAKHEGLERGDLAISPSEPLVTPSFSRYQLWG